MNLVPRDADKVGEHRMIGSYKDDIISIEENKGAIGECKTNMELCKIDETIADQKEMKRSNQAWEA